MEKQTIKRRGYYSEIVTGKKIYSSKFKLNYYLS